ncbi:MAG: beta-hydroxyacyl-ACP dehydratase [Nitrospiraceae bacterium]|nr:MAG: beta-hydroxyacyl-ACP dehydratase [Nitrospiraceae bacterium]
MTGTYPLPATILPHSYPFVLIDKIIDFEEGSRIICLKNVTVNEEFFSGRFRENPVMPGVLIVEAMAQASGLIAAGGKQAAAYLSRINDARFIRPVVPGDRLLIKSSVIQKFHPLYVFEVSAYVDNNIAAEAEITLSMPEQLILNSSY